MAEKTKKSNGPPDHGYSWIVLVATFIATGLIFGLGKSAGVIYTAIPQNFDMPRAIAAAIPMTAISIMSFLGPVTGALCKFFSYRQLVISGSIVTSIALIISSLANSSVTLMLGYGLVKGVGFALIFLPVKIVLVDYFVEKRSLAISLSFAGSCVGGIAVPPLVEFLIETYTLRGMFMLMAGVVLNVVVCGALFRPVPRNSAKPNQQTEELQESNIEEGEIKMTRCSNLESEENKMPDVIQSPTLSEKPHSNDNPAGEEKKSRSLLTLFNCNCDDGENFPIGTLLLISVTACCQVSSFSIFTLTTPDHAVIALRGSVNRQDAALLLSFFSFGDMFGRVFTGWITNRQFFRLRQQFSVNLVLVGTVSLAIPYISSYVIFSVYSAMFGFISGAASVMPTLLINDYFSPVQMPIAYGILSLFIGIPFLILAPIIGLVRDTMGSYAVCYFIQGTIAFFGASLLLFVILLERIWKTKVYHVYRKKPAQHDYLRSTSLLL